MEAAALLNATPVVVPVKLDVVLEEELAVGVVLRLALSIPARVRLRIAWVLSKSDLNSWLGSSGLGSASAGGLGRFLPSRGELVVAAPGARLEGFSFSPKDLDALF